MNSPLRLYLTSTRSKRHMIKTQSKALDNSQPNILSFRNQKSERKEELPFTSP